MAPGLCLANSVFKLVMETAVANVWKSLLAVFVQSIFASSAVASVLCEQQKGAFSTKLFAGSQIFTNSPSPYSSTGRSFSDGRTSYNTNQFTLDSSNGALAGAELIYEFPRSRLSAGLAYSYSAFDTTTSGLNSGTTASPDGSSASGSGSFSSLQSVTESSIRLSGYYDISKKDWKLKPYAIAAFSATNVRRSASSTSASSLTYGTSSDGSSYSGSSSSVDTTGSSTSWAFNPELGMGLGVPISDAISVGSELRFIPRDLDTTLPLQVLGYLKYNFVNASNGRSVAACEVIEVKGKSVGAIKELLGGATADEIQELADYLKTKRQLNKQIAP